MKKKDNRGQAESPRMQPGRRVARRKKANHSGSRPASLQKILPLFPLMLAVGVVPLVVFLKVTPIPPEYQQFWVTSYVFDFFSFYKAQIILACAGLLLAAVLVLVFLDRLSWKKNLLYIPLGIYAILLIASTIASKYPSIAQGGFFDRAEGMWVLLAYIVLLAGTYQLVTETKQAWWILSAWAAALCVVSVIGIFQFFGLDFFSSMAGRLLIVPARYRSIAAALDFNFPRFYIYSTLYNPNYVASMMSLAFPVAATGFILAQSRKRQGIFGLLAGLLCLTLVGANGRVGWIAVLLALVLLVALSIRRGIPGWWKRLGILVLVAVVEFGMLNYASHGNMSARASQPVEEAGKMLGSGTSPAIAGNTQTPEETKSEGLAEQLIRKYGGLASGRGYIWIRSLQMAGGTILLGRGPDTFALYFPNQDAYKTFYNPFSQSEIFIDKPHNMYLQLWLNLGGLATLAFLAMAVMHFIRTFRLLKHARPTGDRYLLALGLFIGWCAYLLAAFFYDSAVSVAPAFWIVFGLSLAMNEQLNLT